jgi:hypothetical protein
VRRSSSTSGTRASSPAASWLLLLAVVVVVAVFWRSPVLFPLRILVVLFHEMGHAAAAILTGGRVVDIAVSANEGGMARTVGGWSFVVLNAGYLGSLAAGAVLLVLSRRPRASRGLVIGLGLLVLGVAVLYVRPLLSFGFGYTLLAGASLLALARWAPQAATWQVLRLIGVFSVLYALFDIRDDVLYRTSCPSDARMLADLTYVPAVVWGVLWIAAGVVLLWRLRRRLV